MLQSCSESPEHRQPPSGKTALRVFVFFLMAFLSVSSGIIASSDGVTIFSVTQAIIEDGDIAVRDGNVTEGADGRMYSRYGIGLSLAAIPFYLLGKAVSAIAPTHLTPLVLKGVVSLTNAVISAIVCVLLFFTTLRFGYSQRVAFQLTIAFAFSTFFIVYATKSFLTQPLETLCLLGAIYCLVTGRRERAPSHSLCAGVFAGVGILTKWFFVINVPVLTAYLWLASTSSRRAKDLLLFAVPVGVMCAAGFWYNFLRFGSIRETGYVGFSAFSTPLFVGLYGLLLTSGKSLFLYAPVTLLGVLSLKSFAEDHKQDMWLLLGLFLINLFPIAKWRDWGGDGAWGPRYLTLVVPCLMLPIASLLEGGSRAAKRGFVTLMILGSLIHVGGVSVYYGTYFRVIGEFPYQREFSDPLFLYKARYIPNYSPAWGQLEMAVRNWNAFVRGEQPILQIARGEERIPLSEDDREKLSDTLDLWFAYAYYAGLPLSLCLGAAISMAAGAIALGWTAGRSSRLPETVGNPPPRNE